MNIVESVAFIDDVLGEASDIAMDYYGHVSAERKLEDNNQIRTEGDEAIGKRIIRRIQEADPDSNIVDEEAGVIDNGSRFTWVIDPIDGTSNFAAGSPLFGILLGRLDRGEPVAGGIALPFFKERYIAAKGLGATKNGSPISVSSEADLLDVLVAYGIDGHQEMPEITIKETELLAQIILGCRNLRMSNSVFDTAQVLQGTYGLALNRTSKIWDNVAQQIIMQEAGGIYTDFFGHPINYFDPLTRVDQNFTCCAGPKVLHDQVQAIIHGEAA